MRRRTLLALSTLSAIGPVRSIALAQAPVRTRVETALGAFVVAVDTAAAPVTAANYLAYVDAGLLDRASVYRIVTLANQPTGTSHKIEVVQWGLNLPDGQPPPLAPIRHESTRETGLRHRDGTISMARSVPGSAAADFFLCIGEQPELDFGGRRNPDGQGFAAFGQVVEGMDVVRALHARGEAQQMLAAPIAVRRVRRA
jgi:peptidyl-prolyl cis-trans isomerase A (cyclophilin A)